MSWLVAVGGFWLGGAVATWLFRHQRVVATVVSVVTTLAGACFLAAAALTALRGSPEVWSIEWTLPFGSFALRLDPLSGAFLLPVALIGGLGAIYAPAYLREQQGDRSVGSSLAAFEFLLASMALAAVAANSVLLLMAWELMTLLSWYLLTSDHEQQEVRAAGLSYLVAGHISSAALLLLFVFISQAATGWQIPTGPIGHAASLPPAGILLGLAFVGFGTKAALAPLHVWLPDAHAAAPSHVSALMSGVLITLGFYGLLRFIPILGPLSPTVGMVVMGLGAVGASGGIVMALSQGDVKRVLAYSTVENAGLVTLAIGTALLASALGRPAVAALAWTAALLHIWNHAVAKSLLFFAAGAVAQVVHSRDLERWGGLLRRLPLLGTSLLIGAAALVGLPGTHGFAGEWLLFMALIRGSQELAGHAQLAMILGVVAAAFTVGMALACFVRVVGVGLLGHPRSRESAEATEPRTAWLSVPALALAGLCFILVALLHPLIDLLGPAIEQLAPGTPMAPVHQTAAPLPWLALVLATGALAVAAGRFWVRQSRHVRRAVTWDCGYSQPAPTMQYSASSLAQPVTQILQPALRSAVQWRPPRGLWPGPLAWGARTPERALGEIYQPAFARVAQWLGFFARLQEGHVTVYLRYVGVALLVLFVWLCLHVNRWR